MLAKIFPSTADNGARPGEFDPVLAKLFHVLGEGLVLVDANGRIRECNGAAERILGLSRDQLLGVASTDPRWRTIRDDGSVFPADEQPAMLALRSGASVRGVEMGVETGRGRPTWILINAEPLRMSGGQVEWVVVSFSDITARKEAQLALAESERSFHAFMAALPGIACITSADGRPVFVNRESAGAGGPDDGFARTLLAQLQAPAAAPEPMAGPRLSEETVVRDGEARTFLATKFPIRREADEAWVGAIAIDVTDYKRAEIALRAMHDRLQRLGDNLPAGYTYQLELHPDGQMAFTFVSAGVAQVHGFEAAEVMRDPAVLIEQVTAEDQPRWRALLEESRTKLSRFSIDLRIRTRSGVPRWLQVNSSPSRREDGVVQWDGVALDITEAKQAEESRMIRSKLQSTGTLAAGIAHDFNNLLGAIRLNLDMGRSAAVSRDQAEHCWREIARAVEHARDLTRKLITFAAGGRPSRRSLALGATLRDAAALVLGSAAADVRIEVADDVAAVEGDPDQLMQAIGAVLLNAREATARGGTIVVRAANIAADAVLPPGLPAGRMVGIRIADTGVGIAAELLPRIFDPYFSTKERGAKKGMGLGLTICRSILERHGGAVAVRSTPGAGTDVDIFLPASTERPLPVVPSVREPAAAKATGRILVMDDDEGLRSVLAMTLELLGHEVAAVAGGAEAVAEFRAGRERGRPYDAVVLDLTVPGGFGAIRVLEELRGIDPQVRAIVMSGYSDDVVLHDWAQSGFIGALIKPFDEGRLRAVLARALTPPAASAGG